MNKEKRKARIKQLEAKIKHAMAWRSREKQTGKGHLVKQFESAIEWHKRKLKKEE